MKHRLYGCAYVDSRNMERAIWAWASTQEHIKWKIVGISTLIFICTNQIASRLELCHFCWRGWLPSVHSCSSVLFRNSQTFTVLLKRAQCRTVPGLPQTHIIPKGSPPKTDVNSSPNPKEPCEVAKTVSEVHFASVFRAVLLFDAVGRCER